MRVADTPGEFDRVLERNGIGRTDLDAGTLLDVLGGWYRSDRYVDSLPLDEDGDMLLVQWGRRVEPGLPAAFVYSAGRPVLTDHEDEGFWQLNVRLTFDGSPPPDEVPNGHRWCTRPDDFDAFRTEITTGPEWRAVAGRRPTSVDVDWGPAG